LGLGRHLFWGRALTEHRWCTDQLEFYAAPEVRGVLPNDWYREIQLGKRERGILYRDECPVAFLRPGAHRFWTIDPSVRLEVLSVDQPLPELTDELIALIPRGEVAVGYIGQHHAAPVAHRRVHHRRSGTRGARRR
jgi:hypothetical protein